MEDKLLSTDTRLNAPLTPRERDVLHLLAQHLRYQDIAEKLTMAVTSIKWYTQQIYGKLGVDNRRDAIRQAQELGLLEVQPPSAPTQDTQPHHNLPRQLTSFIGREQEIDQVVELVRRNPLVTLTGTGGVGKTRLAQVVAGELVRDFHHGAWLVELAPLANEKLVLPTVAGIFGLQELPSISLLEALTTYLREKQLLLILDNCEHLIEACARLTEHLLKTSSRLSVLATSRERLGIAGEMVFRVPSLSLPKAKEHLNEKNLLQSEAVCLFIDRAARSQAGFALDAEKTLAVAQICHRLDGIPLAIELAAPRAGVLGLIQLAAGLDDAFHLLTGGGRTALPRHQTLRASIDWSYNLLSDSERTFLDRLAIFAGGWTLEAAESICGFDELPSMDILDLLLSLVNKSLVVPDASGGEPRYFLLETIRQYAQAKLTVATRSTLAERHLSYFRQLAERAEPQFHGKDQVNWMDRMEAELDNLRLAMEWSLESRVVDGMMLAAALSSFWHIRGRASEGIEWCEKMLAAEAKMPGLESIVAEHGGHMTRSLARVRALRVSSLGSMQFSRTFPKQDYEKLMESAEICRRLGAPARRDLCLTLIQLGHSQNDLDQATSTLQEALDLARQMEDVYLIAECLSMGSLLLLYKGFILQARPLLEECLECRRELGDRDGIASCVATLGGIAGWQGDYQKAKAYLMEGKEYFQAVGDHNYLAETILNLSRLECSNENFQEAERWGNDALSIAVEKDHKSLVVVYQCNLGLVAWANGNYDLATRRGEEAISLAKKLDYGTGLACHLLGRIFLSRAELSTAENYLMKMLSANSPILWPEIGVVSPLDGAYSLESAAVLAAAQGHMKRAVVLFGAIQERWNQIKGIYCPKERREHQSALDSARIALGEEEFSVVWAEGQATTLEQARANLLAELNQGREAYRSNL